MKLKLHEAMGLVALVLLGVLAMGTVQDFNNYKPGTYATIYANDAVVAQSIPTGAGHTKLTLFDKNGDDNDCTADVANDKVTVTHAGVYSITGSYSFASGTGSVVWHVAPFINGTEAQGGHFERKTPANDVGSAAISCVARVGANEDVDVRVTHDSGGAVNLTMSQGSLNVIYLGE